MRRSARTTLLAIAFTLGLANPARAANTWGTDLSDLWWIPSESGWGVNLAHQREVVFTTLFVYGQDGKPRWYVASLFSRGTASPFIFDGDLYEATGPYFGNPFNPANVARRKVGTATLDAPTTNEATLGYTVDGTTVRKAIQRQTFRNADLSGRYLGAMQGAVSGCASGNGSYEEPALFSITHTPETGAFSMVVGDLVGNTCTYTCTYVQSGRMGTFNGNSRCTDGSAATITAVEIEASFYSFNLRFGANYGGNCQEAGFLSGLKRY